MVKFHHLVGAAIWLFHGCLSATEPGTLRLDGATELMAARGEGDYLSVYTAQPFEKLLQGVCKESLADTSGVGARFLLSTSLGAEPGDPLLNAYTGHTTFNRDHFSQSYGFLRQGPVVVYGGYRYLDTYSDRFDSIWTAHALEGFAMQHSALGLAEELVGGARVTGARAMVEAGVNRYNYWGHTSLWFTPLLHRGVRGYSEGRLLMRGWRMEAQLALDKQQRYLDRVEPHERSLIHLDATLSRCFSGLTPLLSLSYDNDQVVPLSVGAAVPFDVGVVELSPHAGVDNQGMTGGILAGAGMSNLLRGQIDVAWARVSMTQGYHYWERGQVVEVEDAIVSGMRVNLQVSSVAKDSLVWAHIKLQRDGTALVDRVEYGDTIRVAPSVVDARLQGRCGAGLRYGVNSWQMAMDLAAEWLMDGGPAQVTVPVEGAASVRWQHPNAAAVWGKATLHGRAGVDYFRFEQSLPVTYSSDARIWVDFSIGVPLLMPLFAEQIKPRVVVEVSSLTLAGKRRQPMHPLGNAIGPAIAVRADLIN